LASRPISKFATVHIDHPCIVALGQSDLQGALALSSEANWNQTLDDWKMMLASGRAIGIAGPKRRLVASALILPFGQDFGWVSMVLVTQSHRKNGLATDLLARCIEMLEQDGLTPVLDATPAGEPLYRSLGFEPHFSMQRWAIDDATTIGANANPLSRPLGAAEMNAVKAYDADVFGGDRGTILDALLQRSGGHAHISGNCSGFVLGRNGRIAHQIGPLCADDSAIAVALLSQTLKQMSGPVFIDACDHQSIFVERLKALGFKKQRPFLRMAKAKPTPFGERARMFAMAGPELG